LKREDTNDMASKIEKKGTKKEKNAKYVREAVFFRSRRAHFQNYTINTKE
jgi:hypothetical protein